jgi:hypothetical protein
MENRLCGDVDCAAGSDYAVLRPLLQKDFPPHRPPLENPGSTACGHGMYYPFMSTLFQETAFLKNLYATPADWQRDLFYSVVRAGHLQAGFEHRIERETYPGHELILCLKGGGWVQVAGKRHEVGPGGACVGELPPPASLRGCKKGSLGAVLDAH